MVGGLGVAAASCSSDGDDGLGQADVGGGRVEGVPEGGKPYKKTTSGSGSTRFSQGGATEVEGMKASGALPTELWLDVQMTGEGTAVRIKQRSAPSEGSRAVPGAADSGEEADSTMGSRGEVLEEPTIVVQQAPDEEEGQLSGGMAEGGEAGAPTTGSASESEAHVRQTPPALSLSGHNEEESSRRPFMQDTGVQVVVQNGAEQDVRIFLPATTLNAAEAEPSANGAALAHTCLQYTAFSRGKDQSSPPQQSPASFSCSTPSIDLMPAAGSLELDNEGTACASEDVQLLQQP